jgi:hypothetical protein
MSDTPQRLQKFSLVSKKDDRHASNTENNGVRVQAKQAILHELNSQLRKHSDKLRSNREEALQSTINILPPESKDNCAAHSELVASSSFVYLNLCITQRATV